MYGKVKNIWDIKSNGGGSSIDTENFAKKNEDNTFTGVNTFENTGSMIKVKTNDNAAFGVEFKNSSDEAVAYVGATPVGNEQKAVFYGSLGASIDTPNKDINLNSGTAHILSNTSKNWNDHIDNSIVRQKDTKFYRKHEYISQIVQPALTWNYTSWNWIFSGINARSGLYEFLVVINFNDDKPVLITPKVVWKNSGISESQSEIHTVIKSDITFYFQAAIKNDNKLYIYTKKSADGGSNTNITWVRVYILRDNNLPTKMSNVW